MGTHKYFGVNLRVGKWGVKLTRDNYAFINKKCTTHESCTNYYEKYWGEARREQFLEIFEDETAVYYTDSWCERHREKVLMNFDLNMAYFKTLDYGEFNESIQLFLNRNNEFKEINDLNESEGKTGYYVMVLDEYYQIYIGTSNNIKRRVMGSLE